MRMHKVLGIGLLALIFAAGCDLVSINLLIDLDVTGTHQSNHENVAEVVVDLTENDDFEEHKDKIDSVDMVGFIFDAQNNIATSATGEIWFSADPVRPLTAAAIRGQATKIVDGLSLPANGTIDVDLQESLELQVEENRPEFHDLVQTGRFYIYGIADTATFNITISQLTVVAVITVGT